MVTFCDFAPEDETCQSDLRPEPIPEKNTTIINQSASDFPVDVNDWRLLKSASPALGQLIYTLLPMIAGTYHGISLFYFRKYPDHYERDQLTSPLNWRMWAMLIQDWGGLGVWGIAFLFQLISLFGAGGELNMIIWYWIVGITGGTAVLTVAAFYFLAIYQVYEKVQTLTSDSEIADYKEYLNSYVVIEL